MLVTVWLGWLTVFVISVCISILRWWWSPTWLLYAGQPYSTYATSRGSSRLDTGNALLYRLPLKQIQRLQKIQNWAARLIDGAMIYSHAIPLLKKLHWLPIAVRVEFMILLLTHRALNGQAPDYIEQCVSRRQPVRSLRSSEHRFAVCATHKASLESFQRGSSKYMDALPQHLTLSYMTTAAFKVKLKTYLFTRIFFTALWAKNVGTALYKCDDYD